MSNQADIDYDKQFQDDMAKATALSLEQQALDDYRRHKKYGPAAYGYGQQQRGGGTHLTQRRHSEIHQQSMAALTTEARPSSNVERSRTPPASQTPENDLISFASPTSKHPEGGGTPFGKLIEDLQRLQTTNPQTALVPLAPAQTPGPHYGFAPPPSAMPYGGAVAGAAGAGMQLVPYQPQQQQQQRPLNNEELQRLYSLPNHNQLAVVQPVVQPTAYLYYPGAVPIVPGSAAFMPPQYVSHGYGYAQHPPGSAAAPPASIASTHMDFSRPNPPPSHPPATNNGLPSQPKIPEANGVSLPPRRVASTSGGQMSSTGVVHRTGNDLIDLNQEDYSRVSVLEAFDPLLNENTGNDSRLQTDLHILVTMPD
ncbi:uncharacterized protein LOC124460651 [Drosophila willistoni]|uniref:uncharacterized protein LOC124460651 n=1 Tax=Drosophila willistoni TaxID=7260 RepID=UPI001F07618E|nr:uncharacterized protein LOC124460651 [Drosophila willistoni]